MKLLTSILAASAASTTSALDCSITAFSSVVPANATVISATTLPANSTYKVPASDVGYPRSPSGLPALCAIEVHVQTPGNTSFGFGLFLPVKWNGRFLASGNGGFAGGIDWSTMGTGVGYGFAAMSTDTGHLSNSGDGTWALNNPESVTNWGYRAMHGSVVLSKSIISAYYNASSKYNYYNGCSTGGRQGLKEAELFPEDFDGIVAGAPAWWTSHLQPWTVKVGTYNLPLGSAHSLSPAQYELVAAEVIKQCDPQDGVTDQVVSDPYRCSFRPETLLCKANVTNATANNCLTSAQISTVNLIHSDWVEANQTFVFPHLAIGSEAQWPVLVENPEPAALGTGYIQNFLNFGPSWNYTQFNPSYVTLSDEVNPGNATVRNFDFTPFEKRGGKLLMYHGLSDGLIPTGSSIYFYEQLYRAMEPTMDVSMFYKFFLVPGMQHCGGSPPAMNAPVTFGPGSSTSGPQGILGDAKHNVLLAMMAWVENGTAPAEIVVSKFADQAMTKVVRDRPLCAYPLQAKWDGVGDVNKAESWSCKSLY